MFRIRKIRVLLLLPALLAALLPALMVAQDDPNDPSNDVPLGDVARNLRKKTPSSQNVIDDDNLTKVMEQAESHQAAGSALKFLMAGDAKGFQVAAPDATCSLSFTANAKALLSSQYAQMELPTDEVRKLEGPATIEGDALIVALLNRSDWHVSEVAVALTVVKKTEARNASLQNDMAVYSGAKLQPAMAGNPSQESEVRPEKKPDETVIYRMRAAAPPSVTTVFSAPLNLELAPDEEWHWAIVQARGYPPRTYTVSPLKTLVQANGISSASPQAATSPQPILIQPTSAPPAPAQLGSAPATSPNPSAPPAQNPR